MYRRLANLYGYLGINVENTCLSPDDHLSKRIWKLATTRDGMGMLLQSLRQQQQ